MFPLVPIVAWRGGAGGSMTRPRKYGFATTGHAAAVPSCLRGSISSSHQHPDIDGNRVRHVVHLSSLFAIGVFLVIIIIL
jgi:hypothetical protein